LGDEFAGKGLGEDGLVELRQEMVGAGVLGDGLVQPNDAIFSDVRQNCISKSLAS